jgi:hypothetical protein
LPVSSKPVECSAGEAPIRTHNSGKPKESTSVLFFFVEKPTGKHPTILIGTRQNRSPDGPFCVICAYPLSSHPSRFQVQPGRFVRVNSRIQSRWRKFSFTYQHRATSLVHGAAKDAGMVSPTTPRPVLHETISAMPNDVIAPNRPRWHSFSLHLLGFLRCFIPALRGAIPAGRV